MEHEEAPLVTVSFCQAEQPGLLLHAGGRLHGPTEENGCPRAFTRTVTFDGLALPWRFLEDVVLKGLIYA